MNSNSDNNLLTLVNQAFRVTVGATASLIETIQDPTKREIALSELQNDLQEKTTEWAQKGETTEMEARRMIDELLQKQGRKNPEQTTDHPNGTTASSKTSTEMELKELTEKVIALRTELEKSQES